MPQQGKIEGGGRPRSYWLSATGGSLRTVAHSVDRAVVVVRDEQRAVLHDQHVNRPPDIVVVLEEASHERLHRSEGAVRFELHQHKVTADLGAGIEAHPQGRRMWTQQCERLGELTAGAPPPEFRVRDIALVAIGEAEI